MSRLNHGLRGLSGSNRDPEGSGSRKSKGRKITAGVPLAKLIKRKLANVPELVLVNKPSSVAAERFRRLRTVLANLPDGSPQVIVVSSSGSNEGKSFVSTNLALAFAADMQGQVLLVDSDMRRPSVEKWLDPPPKLGLSELLRGSTEPEHVILDLDNAPLKILPAGAIARDPVELLTSENASALISALRRNYKRIVIDSPPIVPFTDADVLGGLSDGILLVTRSDRTRQSAYLQAIASVSSTRVLGAVLNDQVFSLADRSSYGEYRKGYYEYFEDKKKK